MKVFDTAKVWLSESVGLLSTDSAALDAFIEAVKQQIVVARNTLKQSDLAETKYERTKSRVDSQHQLQVLVPTLRLSYSLRQRSKRAFNGYELATFLLACTTNSSKRAMYAPTPGYLPSPGWSGLSRTVAAGLIRDHPRLFASLPEAFARAYRGIGSVQYELDLVELITRKARLRDRILAEMSLSDEEASLLRRFL